MNIYNKQQELQLINLIQFAFAEKRFTKVIELADQFHTKFPQSKDIYLYKAKASSEINKVQQCLQALEKANALGTDTLEIQILKLRSYIQLGNTMESVKVMEKLLSDNKQMREIVQLKLAMDIFNDKNQIHRLSQKQQKILQKMEEWLQKSGATYPKLRIIYFHPGYRGVVATKHIKKKQPIIFIPKSQLITLEMAKANKYSQTVLNKNTKLQSPKHTLLSILLLQLKTNQNSKYRPYIDLLPQDNSYFPINYSNEELQMLEGSPFLNLILEKAQDLKKDYNTIVQVDNSFQKYSFKQFCWARMMVGSRIFGVIMSGVKTDVLAPFGDMLNHRNPKQTVWSYQQSMNGFVIESLEDIEVGEEVFDSYGKKCNSRFLLNYGFVVEDNPDNQIILKIEIKSCEPLSAVKLQMIKEDPTLNYIEIRKINLNFNNNKFYQLMGCLRFVCIDDQQTIEIIKNVSNISVTKQAYLMTKTPPISIQNELLAWQKLQNMCKLQLEGYPKISVIEKVSQRKKRQSYNQKNINILLKGQKYILGQLIKISGQVMSILQSTEMISALREKIQKIYARYLFKILCVTPGINRKEMQKHFNSYFVPQGQEGHQEEYQQVGEH